MIELLNWFVHELLPRFPGLLATGECIFKLLGPGPLIPADRSVCSFCIKLFLGTCGLVESCKAAITLHGAAEDILPI